MTTEASLLQRLQQYDPATWIEFVDKWSPDLYNYLFYNVRTLSAAEALLVETFDALVQSIATVGDDVPLSTYIYAIAYRKVADYWRRPQETYKLPSRATASGPTNVPSELADILAELPEQAQQILCLRYHEGLTLREIAEVLGRSYKATESLFNRVSRQFLARLVQEQQQLSDEELFALFQTRVTRHPLPPGLLERLQQQVLTQIQR